MMDFLEGELGKVIDYFFFIIIILFCIFVDCFELEYVLYFVCILFMDRFLFVKFFNFGKKKEKRRRKLRV